MIKNTSFLVLAILETGILALKFPDAIQPPNEVPKARLDRYYALISSLTQGVFVRVFITAVELVVGLSFGSAALFMDAMSTALDISTSLVLLFSIKLASRPPDDNHPFGHGRYEPLAGLLLGLFLALLGFGMFFYNTNEISNIESHAALHPLLWIVPLGAMVLLEVSYQRIMATAKKQNSPALTADALHYRMDSITSFFALIALLLASYLPNYGQYFDHAGAALIALFMIISGIYAARKNMNQLLDHIPPKDYFEKVRRAAFRTAGVLGTEKTRIQLYGPDAHVDIDVEVDPEMSVEAAHEISQKVRIEIQKELPEVRDVTVHIEPFYPNDHDEVL